jgi:hypothetical protein
MATVAFFTQMAFMGFDLLVAIKTKAWRLAERNFRKVAPLTWDVFMGAIEPKIRKGMVEGLPIELNDVGATSFVIGMAALAVRLRRIGVQSMESFVQPAIGRRLLMAIETKPCLGGARKRCMAIGAFFFELGMPFDDGARHDQLFQYVLGGGGAMRCD